MDRPPCLPRRRFLHLTGAAVGLAAMSACASTARLMSPRRKGGGTREVGQSDSWLSTLESEAIEIIREGIAAGAHPP